MSIKLGVARYTFGALPTERSTRFAIWAPRAASVSVVVESGARAGEYPMARGDSGLFSVEVPRVGAGDLYRFRADGSDPMPDPASRFQPRGVHGPSQVVDADRYDWSDESWRGVDAEQAVMYELHVGSFTPEGTLAAAAGKLRDLQQLGATIVELMPLADFAGTRNWGYDGVALFAPARVYGEPDDLRRFVDQAHRLGLAVVLDVVYNHLGPDGAYMNAFAPPYFTSRHVSAWGDGVNVDGPESQMVRRFIVENAMYWIADYHMDGLRLDATHALADDSPLHIVSEIVRAAKLASSRPVIVVAEDHRNLDVMLRETTERGWGLDGVWADDFHHIMRRILAGDREGYYEDYEASVPDLATTICQGWFYTGQHSRHLSGARGTDPAGIPRRKFVICLQNHDQIGNRAYGDRLHHAVALDGYRAASAVLLLAPETPLLFMGQEWAASSPFRYFTDHTAELGTQIVEGRRREFARFADFRDPDRREQIPSPQEPATFEACKLRWDERSTGPHGGIVHLYRRLLELRRYGLRRWPEARDRVDARALDDETLLVGYPIDRFHVAIVARLRGSGAVALPELKAEARVLLTTEDPQFTNEGHPPRVSRGRIEFPGPAAIVLTWPR
jgi:maltooligosyltrehalose trehalohydrolase